MLGTLRSTNKGKGVSNQDGHCSYGSDIANQEGARLIEPNIPREHLLFASVELATKSSYIIFPKVTLATPANSACIA